MPKSKTSSQIADIRKSADLDEKRVLPELDSDNPENMSTSTRTLGSIEFAQTPTPKKPHLSKTLGKYLTHLKTIKRPKINNSGLLARVDQVSRSIEGCIKLVETALDSSTSQQNPTALKPPQKRSGDMLSGIDRVNSKLVDCIKAAESIMQDKGQKTGGGICGGYGETNLQLVGWDRLSPRYLRALHRNLLTFGLQNQSSPHSIRTLTAS